MPLNPNIKFILLPGQDEERYCRELEVFGALPRKVLEGQGPQYKLISTCCVLLGICICL